MPKAIQRSHGQPRHAIIFEQGNNFLRKGKQQEAAKCFRTAVEQAPSIAEYYSRLAEALGNLQNYKDMLHWCTVGLERCGEDPQLWSYMGIALFNMSLWKDAAVAFGHLTKLRPEFYKGYYLLALALTKAGDLQLAQTCFELACSKDSRQPEVWMAWGDLCMKTGDWQRGLDCFQHVLEFQPDSVPALNNLSSILLMQGNPEAAESYLRQAVRLEPNRGEPLRNLGAILLQMGKRREALDLFAEILKVTPDNAQALSGAYWVRAQLCLWEQLPDYERRLLEAVDSGADIIPPFAVLRTSAGPEQQMRCARQFGSAQALPGVPMFAPRPVDRRKRLRLGYISADLQEHATAYLISQMIELHDRERFQVFAYSYGKYNGGGMRARLQRAFDQFIDISQLSLEKAAQTIYADGIDILVDLKGHTKDARPRILSYRPAPVQVAYLGYPGSMGVPYYDYAIADPYVMPAEAEQHFSEKVVYLPDSYQINDRERAFSEQLPTRAEYGLPEEGMILCSFNLAYKITPEVFGIWMHLLHAAPNAVLWILESESDTVENLKREASNRGISPDRLIFAPRLPFESHCRRLRIADLMLDTFPVNAHTSASDALWAGCPVLTRSGDTFVSRVAGSLLHAAGLPELITESLEEYEAKALRLISHPEELRRLRGALEANRLTCPLFNSRKTTREIESAYEAMWQIYCEGGSPRSFSVPRCV